MAPLAVPLPPLGNQAEQPGLRSRAHALSAALANALAELNEEIASGAEYPDAQHRVSRKHKVPYQLVQALYDKQGCHA